MTYPSRFRNPVAPPVQLGLVRIYDLILQLR